MHKNIKLALENFKADAELFVLAVDRKSKKLKKEYGQNNKKCKCRIQHPHAGRPEKMPCRKKYQR